MKVILIQKNDIGWKYAIIFASKSNNNIKLNYSSYERKALVLVWNITQFWPYLYGQHFILVINYQSLK